MANYTKNWVKNHEYLELSREICTSKDFEKKSASAILDANWTKTKKNLVKIIVWYDNEWGYSSRVIDLAKKINK